MRAPINWLAGALIALYLPDPCTAAWPVEAERAFAEGSRHFEEGDYDLALRQFRRAQDVGMTTASVSYNIGVCQYRVGDFAAAELTFRGIARDFPQLRSLARYNLGLALVKQNRGAEARSAFEEARRGDEPVVARLAAAMLGRVGPQAETGARLPPAQGRSGFVELGFGYDDNVALLNETNVSTGETTESPFGEFFGMLGGRLGNAPGLRWDASAYLVHYSDADRFNQAVARLGAAWERQIRERTISIAPYYSHSTLDGDGYDHRLGLTVASDFILGAGSRFVVGFAYEEIGELDSRYDFVAGNRRLLELCFARHSGPHRLTLRYDYSVDDRKGDSVSPVRHSFRAALERQLDAWWSVGGEASFRSGRYEELAEPRDEDLMEYAVLLARNLSDRWQISGEYRYSDNDSSAAGFAYRRHRATLAVNRIF